MAECALDILAKKWRILHRPFNVTPQRHDILAKACCVHNFDRPNDRFKLEDTSYEGNFESIHATGTRGNTRGKHVSH